MTHRAVFLRRPRLSVTLGCAALVLLGACAPGDKAPNLMRFRNSSSTPDEFRVAPARPLETPADVSTLPPPAPGITNRAEPTPIRDAVTALGGSTAAIDRQGIPSGDQAVVTYTTRYGTDPAIRATLAEEDLRWRQGHNLKPLERWANVNGYFRAYDQQLLDQQAEIERLRARGIQVPSAPPKELKPR